MADRVTTFRKRVAGQIIHINANDSVVDASGKTKFYGSWIFPYNIEVLSFSVGLIATDGSSATFADANTDVELFKDEVAVTGWKLEPASGARSAIKTVDVGSGVQFTTANRLAIKLTVPATQISEDSEIVMSVIARIQN